MYQAFSSPNFRRPGYKATSKSICMNSIRRFYTLLVVSTALFNKPLYRNLIVNGLVLAKVSVTLSVIM